MFDNFRRQSEELIKAVHANTEELQNIKLQLRSLNVSASTPPKTTTARPGAKARGWGR